MSKRGFLGGIWPVVQRELREEARRPLNFWLRWGAALAAMAILLYTLLSRGPATDQEIGRALFSSLHGFLLALICVAGPLLTADCLASEKREGTLGLLFLTPLTAGGVVVGKGLAQALRAATLWVAAAPMLTIPFLTGGVSWQDASAALALELAALWVSVAIGLLASTLVKNRNGALILALLLQGVAVAGFCAWNWQTVLPKIPFFTAISRHGPWVAIYSGRIVYFGSTRLGPGQLSAPVSYPILEFVSFPISNVAAAAAWRNVLTLSPLAAFCLDFLVLSFAAARLSRAWRDQPPSVRQLNLLRRFCTPVFKHLFQRRSHQLLDRNPVVWLQQYSWKARVIKWLLCLVILITGTWYVSFAPPDLDTETPARSILFVVITIGLTLAGVSSFGDDKRSGALELLLVTPITVGQIVSGRLMGIWMQFLPVVVLSAAYCLGLRWVHGPLGIQSALYGLAGQDIQSPGLFVMHSLLALIFVPMLAFYFSLRTRSQLVAALLTLGLLALFRWGPWLAARMLVSSGVLHGDLWIVEEILFDSALFSTLVVLGPLQERLERRHYSI